MPTLIIPSLLESRTARRPPPAIPRQRAPAPITASRHTASGTRNTASA